MTVIQPPTHSANEERSSSARDWAEHGRAYVHQIQDQSADSHFLRERGLKPMIEQMAGDCANLNVLDIGAGTGWLLDALNPDRGVGCDITIHPGRSERWAFTISDVTNLGYVEQAFDVTVASLVLLWIDDLHQALVEIARVTRKGGHVILALVHPFFYRTGEATPNGKFTIRRSLSEPFVIKAHKIAGCVGPFRYHYRPLNTYLNNCIEVGLKICVVTDWYPDMDEFLAHFGTDQPGAIRRTDKVPMYTFIKCERE